MPRSNRIWPQRCQLLLAAGELAYLLQRKPDARLYVQGAVDTADSTMLVGAATIAAQRLRMLDVEDECDAILAAGRRGSGWTGRDP